MDTWGKLYSRIAEPSREGEVGSASGQWNEGVLSLKHTSVRESSVAFLARALSGEGFRYDDIHRVMVG